MNLSIFRARNENFIFKESHRWYFRRVLCEERSLKTKNDVNNHDGSIFETESQILCGFVLTLESYWCYIVGGSKYFRRLDHQLLYLLHSCIGVLFNNFFRLSHSPNQSCKRFFILFLCIQLLLSHLLGKEIVAIIFGYIVFTWSLKTVQMGFKSSFINY